MPADEITFHLVKSHEDIQALSLLQISRVIDVEPIAAISVGVLTLVAPAAMVPALVLTPLLSASAKITSLYASERQYCWIVKSGLEAVGYISSKNRENYSILSDIYIKSDHRRQGIGSHCVKYIKNKKHKPVYVWPGLGSKDFYTRTGFILATKGEVPDELSNVANSVLVLRREQHLLHNIISGIA